MYTNLIFKRTIDTEGIQRTELKIVPLNIPELEEDGGWILCENVHTVSTLECLHPIVEPVSKEDPVSENDTTMSTSPTEAVTPNKEKDVELTLLTYGSKFTTTVPGTAKLIRFKDRIVIGYRKGKTPETYNRTSLNGLCISDQLKEQFFNYCRKYIGSNPERWELNRKLFPQQYMYWSGIIDKEYNRQLELYNKQL